MAENKKSFLLYLTQRPTFEGLSDEEAGQLIKTIFAYVSDENPTPTGIVGYAFNIIKPILKADLVKYEDKRAKLKENISKRWNKEDNKSIEKNTKEYNSIQTDGVIVNDNVNVNDIVNTNVINDKLINTINNAGAFDNLPESEIKKKKKQLEAKGIDYEAFKNLHFLTKEPFERNELNYTDAASLTEVLNNLDETYGKQVVIKAWLYSWSHSKGKNNRTAYIISILEKNCKNVDSQNNN